MASKEHSCNLVFCLLLQASSSCKGMQNCARPSITPPVAIGDSSAGWQAILWLAKRPRCRVNCSSVVFVELFLIAKPSRTCSVLATPRTLSLGRQPSSPVSPHPTKGPPTVAQPKSLYSTIWDIPAHVTALAKFTHTIRRTCRQRPHLTRSEFHRLAAACPPSR